MEKDFAIIKVPEEKRVNITRCYLTGKVDIWWSTVKDRLVGPEFTYSNFLEQLKAKFYAVTIQRQKKKDFIELRMTNNMTAMQSVSKFAELSPFVPEFVASE